MRAALGILVGFVAGAAVMIWFYAHGGNIIVAGNVWGPLQSSRDFLPSNTVDPARPANSGFGSGPHFGAGSISEVERGSPSGISGVTPPSGMSGVTPPSGGSPVSPQQTIGSTDMVDKNLPSNSGISSLPTNSGSNSFIVIVAPRW